MRDAPPSPAERPGPSDGSDPRTIGEAKRAAVWIGMAAAVVALWFLAQPLLLIVGGVVVAAILDGGTRLLGRILPIGRSWRLAIVSLAGFGFLLWTIVYAGATIGDQFATLRSVVVAQVDRLMGWAEGLGIVPHGGNQLNAIAGQLMGSLGQLTNFVGSALGALSSLAMILVIGIFLAVDPRLYERGVAWLLPLRRRADFYRTAQRMGYTLRRLMAGRLLGMAVEGVGTGALLALGGVPMAALLGILTGLLAFLPNIGAIVSGVLLVLVGFSAGFDTGLWAIGVYVVVQIVDGYIIVPMVAKRSVDLAPALVLGAQLLAGAMFGILGLALADPIVAMVKVLLEEGAPDEEPAKATPKPGRLPLEGV